MQLLDEIWEKTLCEMRKDYSRTQMELWFEELKLTSLTEDSAVLVNGSDFKRDLIAAKHAASIEEYLRRVTGFPVKITLISTEKKPYQPPQSDGKGTTDKPAAEAPASPAPPVRTTDNDPSFPASFSELSRRQGISPPVAAPASSASTSAYTFDNFVVGESNKFAHAACLSVVNSPGREYNPLFIHGSSGLGKTHLLGAIINETRRRRPEAKIIYIKGDEFTNQLIESIGNNTNAAFRDRFRRADVLLIDDIQFIAGKDSTQEEFFHTFNALYEDGKQIIVTSDRPPRDIKTLEQRLRTRFEWGLIADVQPPNFELRIAILKNKAQSLHIDLPADVLEFLAENLKNNVRQLEGVIKKLGAQSFLSGTPVNMDIAVKCAADFMTSGEPVTITVDRILERVSKKYGVSVEDIKSRKRVKDIVFARHVAIYAIRKMTELSLPAIGKIIGRDHSTVLSSLDVIEKEIASNSLFELEMNDLIREIKAP